MTMCLAKAQSIVSRELDPSCRNKPTQDEIRDAHNTLGYGPGAFVSGRATKKNMPIRTKAV